MSTEVMPVSEPLSCPLCGAGFPLGKLMREVMHAAHPPHAKVGDDEEIADLREVSAAGDALLSAMRRLLDDIDAGPDAVETLRAGRAFGRLAASLARIEKAKP